MSNLRRRLERVERGTAAPARIFFTTVGADVPEDQHAAFIAWSRERQGVGDDDVHFITIYEPEPER